jgi:hypothetical protein
MANKRKKESEEPTSAAAPPGDTQDIAPVPNPDPPWYARKAEDYQQEDPSLPWQKFRCRNCNGETWGRMPDKHDICEDCGYRLRVEIAENEVGQIRQRQTRLMNPFASLPIPVKTR